MLVPEAMMVESGTPEEDCSSHYGFAWGATRLVAFERASGTDRVRADRLVVLERAAVPGFETARISPGEALRQVLRGAAPKPVMCTAARAAALVEWVEGMAGWRLATADPQHALGALSEPLG